MSDVQPPWAHTTHGRDCAPGRTCLAPGCDGSARDAGSQMRGLVFRVETACDGYAHLMDEDVPGDVSDLAAYQRGAAAAAEAIRSALARRPFPPKRPSRPWP